MTASARRLSHAARAMTLIEVLAAVALLALAAGVVASGAMGGGVQAQRTEAVGATRAVDALARLAARAEGAVTVRVARDGTSLELWRAGKADARASSALVVRSLPRGVRATLVDTAGGASRDRIEVDALGRTDDYGVRLSRVADGAELAIVRFRGATGASEVDGRVTR